MILHWQFYIMHHTFCHMYALVQSWFCRDQVVQDWMPPLFAFPIDENGRNEWEFLIEVIANLEVKLLPRWIDWETRIRRMCPSESPLNSRSRGARPWYWHNISTTNLEGSKSSSTLRRVWWSRLGGAATLDIWSGFLYTSRKYVHVGCFQYPKEFFLLEWMHLRSREL